MSVALSERIITRAAGLEDFVVPGGETVPPAREPLSILHVCLTHGFGGSERYCADLMRHQRAMGHRVSFVTWRPSAGRQALDPRKLVPGVHVYLARRDFACLAIARAARQEGADIINAHVWDSVRAVKLVRRRPPTVLTMHLRYHASQARGLDGLVLIADWQKKETAGFAGLTLTAHNWPPALVPAAPGRSEELRRLVGAGPGDIVVGYLGRLVPVKDVDLLVKAFRAAAVPRVKLAIVGDGPMRKRLEALAGGDPSIRFLGEQAEAEAWHRAFDLFVLPSHWEGLPLSVLEAMRAGTAILAAASDGSAEALQGTRATLVPPRDVGALRDALGKLLTDREALQRAPYDLSRFDERRSVERIARFYTDVIAAGRRHGLGTRAVRPASVGG
jgi:glycosyltransferase involved in cell wall biosynthesis